MEVLGSTLGLGPGVSVRVIGRSASCVCAGRSLTAWRSASCERWKESDRRRASSSGRDLRFQDLLFRHYFVCISLMADMTEQAWRPACHAIFEISAWELMGPRVSLLASPFYYVAFSLCNL